jgi:hypothetical protein
MRCRVFIVNRWHLSPRIFLCTHTKLLCFIVERTLQCLSNAYLCNNVIGHIIGPQYKECSDIWLSSWYRVLLRTRHLSSSTCRALCAQFTVYTGILQCLWLGRFVERLWNRAKYVNELNEISVMIYGLGRSCGTDWRFVSMNVLIWSEHEADYLCSCQRFNRNAITRH